MALACAVLGRDLEITDVTVPVISPYWRLKRSGDLPLLYKYEHEQMSYSLLPPAVGATLSLMDGRLTFRHLCTLVQYANSMESLETAKEFVTRVIKASNKEGDVIVNMSPELEPYVRKMDPLQFYGEPSKKSRQRRPAAPLSLNLMFSNGCETNCGPGYADKRHIPDNMLLSAKRWKEILREARSLDIEQVTLYGGDPLFRKDALILIAELIKQEMLFFLPTKCCITPEIADKLLEIGMTHPINQYVREVHISMDGPDETIAGRHAGSPAYNNRAVESIRNLVARGFNLRVQAVITPLNSDRICEWIKQLADMGVRRISLAAYGKTGNREDDNLFLSLQDRNNIREQCERARMDFPGIELATSGLDKRPVQSTITMPEATGLVGRKQAAEGCPVETEKQAKGKHPEDYGPCLGGRSSMTITPDGKVILCETVPQDETYFVGDLSRQSILDVWNSEKLLELVYPPREKFVGSPCYSCGGMKECRSRGEHCLIDSDFNFGALSAPPPHCSIAKE